MKRKGVWLFLLTLLTLITAISSQAAKSGQQKGSITIPVGKSVMIRFREEKKDVIWSSSDEAVASVTQEGVVKGIDVGIAMIEAVLGEETVEIEVEIVPSKKHGTALSDNHDETEEDADPVENITRSEYYKSYMKPAMDNIGDSMRKLFKSREEIQSAFEKAKTDGITKLIEACNLVEELKNDAVVASYLETMETSINEGQKYSEKVGSNDEKIMTYQQNTAEALKAFMDYVNALGYTS